MWFPTAFVPFPREEIEQTIFRRFERQVDLHPDRKAVVVDRDAVTYEELNRQANRIAHAILARGGDRSEPVALLLGQSSALVASVLGVLKSGRPYVPLNTSWPVPLLYELLAHAGAGMILAEEPSWALASSLSTERCAVLDAERLCRSGDGSNPGVDPGAHATAYIYYTSGSTGRPKGVSDTHRNVLHNVFRYSNTLGICAEDRLTLLQGSAFSGAVSSMFGALLNGACLFPFDVSRHTPADLAEALVRGRITMYHSVPTIFRGLATETRRYDHVRVVRLEGDQASHRDVELFRRHFGDHCALVNGLGTTETGLVRQYFVDRDTQVTPGILPVGYPVDDMDLYLCHADDRPAAPGEVGEIMVRSEFLAQGYWQRPDLTEQAFVPDSTRAGLRAYRTGDLGRMRPDGCLECLGRRDSRVKIRGQTVDIAEVEAALLRLPSVREAAVVPTHSPGGDPRLVGYVVHAAELSHPGVLRRELARSLPTHMIPARFIEVDALPLNVNGKLDRAALPPLAAIRPRMGTDAAPSTNMLEALLVEIWEQLLDVRPVGIHDEFSALGGDSLLALQLVARIEQRIDRGVPLSMLLDAATVAEMARAIVEHEPINLRAPVVQLNPGGTRCPFFFLHGDYTSDGFAFLHLARCLPPDQPLLLLPPCGLDGTPAPATFEEMATRHLAVMRAIQPHGPYRLGGQCNGGLVAFEMARRLEHAGETVELLVVSRSYGNGVRFRLHDRLARGIAAMLRQGSTGSLAWRIRVRDLAEHWSRANGPERLRLLAGKIRRVRRLLREALGANSPAVAADPPAGDWRQQLSRTIWQAEWLYVPGQYPGRVTLLWPEIDEQTPEEASNWWSRIAQEVELRQLRGDHITCWTVHMEDSARQLAGLLERP